MSTTSLPKIQQQLLAAASQVGAEPFRILITGQIGSDGTATDGATYKDVEGLTDTEVKGLFGTKGTLLGRILRARKLCKGRFSIWVIAKSPAAGTAATLPLAYAGTATEDKTMTVKPLSESKYTFTVSIESGDTGAGVATKVKAGFDALTADFPAANALVTATITLTANDVGTIPNKYVVVHENIAAGITVNTNTTSSRDQMGSGVAGATDPTLTGIFDNVASTRFHTILWPWESDFDEVQDFLEARNVIDNNFLHGVAFIGFDDTQANITAKVNGGTPLNSPNLFFMGNRKVSSAAIIVEHPDIRTAEFASIEGLRLTPDVPIGAYITTSAPLDSLGSPASASLAYYNTPLAETDPADPDLLFNNSEQDDLGDDGYTIIGVNDAVTRTIMGEVISTYKLNSRGEADVSFKYLNYIRTGYLCLELFFRTMKSDYSQSRLTEGSVIGGRAMANAEAIKANYTRVYKLLSQSGYVLTQAGDDAESFFFKNLSITLDIANGKITSIGQLPIVTQIRSFIMSFQLSFTIGG